MKRCHVKANNCHDRDAATTADESLAAMPSRRNLFSTATLLLLTTTVGGKAVSAQEQEEAVVEQVTPEEIAELSGGYNNPNIPPSPEERSGLVVLRVAEVAQYQEKLIRAVVNKDLDIVISPQQIVFGTQILLRNSQIAGNMKLMIEEEIPARRKKEARQVAASSMNTIQAISLTAAKVQRPFEDMELLTIADLYRDLRLQLNQLYEYLPTKGKDKYDGYFVAVTEYEKKIAEGTYNPDTDGILRFDDWKDR